MKNKRPSYYRTIVNSPQWKAWVEENELRPKWDVYESMETGWLSEKHFQAFIDFSFGFTWVQDLE